MAYQSYSAVPLSPSGQVSEVVDESWHAPAKAEPGSPFPYEKRRPWWPQYDAFAETASAQPSTVEKNPTFVLGAKHVTFARLKRTTRPSLKTIGGGPVAFEAFAALLACATRAPL